MAKKRKQGMCIYCCERGPITRDHVPPQSIFPDPKPSERIAVPACRACNDGFKLDDEYFRTFLVSNANAYGDPTARGLWNRKIIGSRNAEPIRRMLRKASWPIEIKTHSGLWVGTSRAVSFDAKRVARIVARIALGLWWNHYRTRPGAEIAMRAGMVKGFNDLEEILARCRASAIGGTVFRYAHGVPVEDQGQSCWFMEFYSTMRFFVFATRVPFDSDWMIGVPRDSLMGRKADG